MENIEAQFNELKTQLEALHRKTPSNKLSMVVFSGDMDKVLAAHPTYRFDVTIAGDERTRASPRSRMSSGKSPPCIASTPTRRPSS